MSVRPATDDDIRFLAQVMQDSTVPVVGHGLFDKALDDVEIAPLAFNEALIRSGANHWGQLGSFVVIEEQGEPVGACAAYRSDDPDRRPLTPDGLKRVTEHLGWTQDQSRAFWRRYVSLFGLFGDLPQLFQPAPYVLEFTGIVPSQRGRGHLPALLAAHVERARAQGYRQIGVSATIGNEAARRGYTKFGFRLHERIGPEAYGNAFPGMDRLLLDI